MGRYREVVTLRDESDGKVELEMRESDVPLSAFGYGLSFDTDDLVWLRDCLNQLIAERKARGDGKG